jgi:hypothetical protein
MYLSVTTIIGSVRKPMYLSVTTIIGSVRKLRHLLSYCNTRFCGEAYTFERYCSF